MLHDVGRARSLFEKAEREPNPGLKARALEEALTVLASLDPQQISDAQRTLITNLRIAHTRRLLVQLVSLNSVSMDAWFDYVSLLFGELSSEVEQLTREDAELRDNYARFIGLWGPGVAEILKRQQSDAR